MVDNQKLLKEFREDPRMNLNIQESADIPYINIHEVFNRQTENNKKLTINAYEKSLIEAINLYQDIYDLEKDDQELIQLVADTKTSKEELLHGLERIYKINLNYLKILGGNLSEYPKDLENLVKSKK